MLPVMNHQHFVLAYIAEDHGKTFHSKATQVVDEQVDACGELLLDCSANPTPESRSLDPEEHQELVRKFGAMLADMKEKETIAEIATVTLREAEISDTQSQDSLQPPTPKTILS